MVSQQKNKMIFSSILADFEFWIGGSGIFDMFSYSYEDGSCISPWTFFPKEMSQEGGSQLSDSEKKFWTTFT